MFSPQTLIIIIIIIIIMTINNLDFFKHWEKILLQFGVGTHLPLPTIIIIIIIIIIMIKKKQSSNN